MNSRAVVTTLSASTVVEIKFVAVSIATVGSIIFEIVSADGNRFSLISLETMSPVNSPFTTEFAVMMRTSATPDDSVTEDAKLLVAPAPPLLPPPNFGFRQLPLLKLSEKYPIGTSLPSLSRRLFLRILKYLPIANMKITEATIMASQSIVNQSIYKTPNPLIHTLSHPAIRNN
ncbi:hypothetical protein SpAn4DRAFT_2037 [Sporomusa ovata]|uniref:Uncharacterized protein n=1 Tax=Sporomusa ovata TaxID=2378 RepID=A0A0U1KVA2_9FIRM|nr:hypothetical protein SpAn4DRAFT_2037 [Sporomusa ovata]